MVILRCWGKKEIIKKNKIYRERILEMPLSKLTRESKKLFLLY